MEESKKKKIIWAVVIILILLIAFLFWILRTSDQKPPIQNTNEEPPIIFTPPSANFTYQEPTVPKQTNLEFDAANLAKIYAERFGTWSTDNPGHNLEELMPLSSNTMKNYLSGINTDMSADQFSGITTKAISYEILDIDDTSANIRVSCQRIKTEADLSENVFYQDIEISMTRSANQWLVTSAFWQE
ncbi:hypothetical protein KKH39_02325 [Patescibacteria group bacterium]|nr:hypothetical protein [Patescibacteria group bacterium]